MLKYKKKIMVNIPLEYCLEYVLNPEAFFKMSRYVSIVRRIEDNKFEVFYKWSKWGVKKYFRVVFKVRREGNMIVYESTGDSDCEHYFIFRFQETGDKKTVVEVESGMKAGFMANLLGRRDYQVFIEEIIGKGILGLAEKLSARREEASVSREITVTSGKGSCRECILYDVARNYCYALGSTVRDPDNPPCGYRYFSPRRIRRGEASS